MRVQCSSQPCVRRRPGRVQPQAGRQDMSLRPAPVPAGPGPGGGCHGRRLPPAPQRRRQLDEQPAGSGCGHLPRWVGLTPSWTPQSTTKALPFFLSFCPGGWCVSHHTRAANIVTAAALGGIVHRADRSVLACGASCAGGSPSSAERSNVTGDYQSRPPLSQHEVGGRVREGLSPVRA